MRKTENALHHPSTDDRKAAIPFVINYDLLHRADLREAFWSTLTASRSTSDKTELTRGTWDVILCLCELHLTTTPAVTTDVCVILPLSDSTIRRSVRMLERLGLAEKHTDKNDQRRQFIVLTKPYQIILDQYVDECSREFKDLIEHHDKHERDNALAALRKTEGSLSETEGSLRESEARYREIFDDAPVALWVEDWSKVKQMIDLLKEKGVENWGAYFADHRVHAITAYDLVEMLQISNANLELYGASTRQEYVDSIDGSTVLPEEIDAFIEVIVGFLEGVWNFDIESWDDKMDGTRIIVRTRGFVPLAHRWDWSRLIYSIEDITARRKAEDALGVALDYAKQANRSKSNFVANMSHELRTPFNAILGFAQMMTTKVFGEHGHSKYLEYAQDILASSEHLLAIVNDILDLSKVESGEMKIDAAPFDLQKSIADCISMIRQDASSSSDRIKLGRCDQPITLEGDERVVKQIILNLLSNANKFTPNDGSITITTIQAHDNATIVKVTDSGKGIAKEDLSKVLEPFGQADAEAYIAHEGTGLGLPLSQKLMELHGGTLELESELGVGTTVTLIFPDQPTETIN